MNNKAIYILQLVIFILCPLYNTWSQVINYETSITIDDNGRKTTERTVQIQVNDKQSNWLSRVEIRHNPKQKFSFNYARIIDHNGNVLRNLKKRNLRTRNDLSYQAFFQVDLTTEFELYWNQYPYLIEYSYSISEEEYLNVAGWTPLLYANVSTLKSSLEINVPLDFKVHSYHTGDLMFKESQTEDRKIYYWQASEVKETINEIFSPPINELIPLVSVVPSTFKYGVDGSMDSWASFGQWQQNLNEGTDRLPYQEALIIDKLINGMEDKREIVKTIYYYLQDNTAYVNVAIDVGGLKSYPASFVCLNKYGDCKALTTYMKAMLKHVGIRSYYSIIYADSNPIRVNVDFPSAPFNHVILMVPLENDTIWLENTSNSLPFNYLGTFTQNRYSLVVDGENSKLIKTPKLHASDVMVERTYQISYDNEGNWKAAILLNLRGEQYEKFRHFYKSKSESDQLREVLNNIDFTGFYMTSWKSDYHRDSSNIKIDVHGNLASPVRKIGKYLVINPLKIMVPDFKRPGERKLDIRINFPISKSDKFIYTLNNIDESQIQLPEGVNISNEYGQYYTSYTLKNQQLTIHEKFTLFDNDVSIEQYPEFYTFINAILDHKKSSAILIE